MQLLMHTLLFGDDIPYLSHNNEKVVCDAQPYILTYIHTYIHTYTHTHIHTYMNIVTTRKKSALKVVCKLSLASCTYKLRLLTVLWGSTQFLHSLNKKKPSSHTTHMHICPCTHIHTNLMHACTCAHAHICRGTRIPKIGEKIELLTTQIPYFTLHLWSNQYSVSCCE